MSYFTGNVRITTKKEGTTQELCNERYSSTSIYAHYNWDFKCLSADRSDRYGFDVVGFVSALQIDIYIYISTDGAPKEKGGPWAPKKKSIFIFFILWKVTLGPSRC